MFTVTHATSQRSCGGRVARAVLYRGDMKWFVAMCGVALCGAPGAVRADDALHRNFITLDVEAGGGSVEVVGSRHGAATGDIGLSAGRWLAPQFGLGVRVASVLYFDAVEMDGHTVSSESDEGEVVGFTRGEAGRWGPFAGRWLASAGIGGAVRGAREIECSGHDEETHCHTIKVLEHKSLVDVSVFGGYQVTAHHVSVAIGARVTADSSGERHVGLGAGVGATF